MTWDKLRQTIKTLDPFAWQIIGKSVLDCSLEELRTLSQANDAHLIVLNAMLDQELAWLRDHVAAS